MSPKRKRGGHVGVYPRGSGLPGSMSKKIKDRMDETIAVYRQYMHYDGIRALLRSFQKSNRYDHDKLFQHEVQRLDNRLKELTYE